MKRSSSNVILYPFLGGYHVGKRWYRQKKLLRKGFHNLYVKKYFTLNIGDKHHCAHDMLKSSALGLL
ncbi:uncharacterized protein METZ01_LOCUS347867 [marine metagenome]|uniref:Uncharacterized protein n=1 Tax=marine metagenome TaxID=408172 RepID=A0A382RBB6_9ZZZZ